MALGHGQKKAELHLKTNFQKKSKENESVAEMPLCSKGKPNILSSYLRVNAPMHAHSHLVVSDSLQPFGLWPTRLLSMGFPRQEYWSGLPFPLPEDLPDPEIETSHY